MDSIGYATLSRQSGLMKEMQIVANNIANSATTGFRQEGLVFSEHVGRGADGDPVSMGRAGVRRTSDQPGVLTQTGAPFDLAIEGEGFFLVETPAGERLTRAGAFTPNAAGELVTPDGFRLLDAGGAPVFVPASVADVAIGPDGTISADGRPLGQIGLVRPLDPDGMIREDGVRFRSEAGVEAAPEPRIRQGFLEGSNVDAVSQLARMIEVQRAYELGQSFLTAEDERIRGAVKTLMR